MTGLFPVDWLTLAVSLFNTILLIWLGVTVLLNAERRTFGLWFAVGDLFLGGLFFLSHTAILGHGFVFPGQGLNFWWHVGWAPVLSLPFAWYAVMLWYNGYWAPAGERLRIRHRFWFGLTLVLAVGAIILLLFFNPLPSALQVMQLDLTASPAIMGVPLVLILYPIYALLCTALSLDVLRKPGPSGRVMGDLARQRARPWLVAASLALLLVSLLVGGVILLVLWMASMSSYDRGLGYTIGWVDLLISSLIALAILTVGQAIVSYEVFTGKSLPRRGLQRYWLWAILLAAGYAVVVSWGLSISLRPVYLVLIATLLMTIFYALLSWGSYAERERYIGSLRPFAASQGLYDRMLAAAGDSPVSSSGQLPFQALCRDVLNAQAAYLIPLGSISSLAGPAIAYPLTASPAIPAIHELNSLLAAAQELCLPLDAGRFGGAQWAVPLWSARGLVGALLLAAKEDGSLYTQEEMEIARTVGERLIDAQASAEIARRLVILQRQRLAQSQVLDRRARRILHDEILPQLHTAMLTLRPDGGAADAMELLADAHGKIANMLRDLPAALAPEERLSLVGALKNLVEVELPEAFDQVSWQISPQAEAWMRNLPALTAEVLYYAAREAIRNAAHHGRGADPERALILTIGAAVHEDFRLWVEDDGIGVAPEDSAPASAPSAAPSPAAAFGSGQGLALHSTMLAVIGGALLVDSVPGRSTRITLTLPLGT